LQYQNNKQNEKLNAVIM